MRNVVDHINLKWSTVHYWCVTCNQYLTSNTMRNVVEHINLKWSTVHWCVTCNQY